MTAPDCCGFECCECCGCSSYREESNGEYFCCCCHLSFGVKRFLFIFIIMISLLYTVHAFWLTFNEYFDSWFGYSLLLTLLPMYAGAILFCSCMTAETVDGRNKLILGTALAMFSVAAFWTWECIYVNIVYKKKYCYDGFGSIEEGNYN